MNGLDKFTSPNTVIDQFNHLNVNKLFQMEAVNFVLRPFEGSINYRDPIGLKFYLQETTRWTKKLTSWIFKFQMPNIL